MKTAVADKPQVMRFVACVPGRRLLAFPLNAARRAGAGRLFSLRSQSSAGGHFRDGLDSPVTGKNLKRRESFRGKFSRRNNQHTKTSSKTGRICAINIL
ncbi:MAG TPA: hypothetical protein VF607_04040 [Verrucomicrobiae bacterium]